MGDLNLDIGKFNYDVYLISTTETVDEYGGVSETETEVMKACYIAKIDTREEYDEEQGKFIYIKKATIYIRDEGETFDKFRFDDEYTFRVVHTEKAGRTLLKVVGVSYAT